MNDNRQLGGNRILEEKLNKSRAKSVFEVENRKYQKVDLNPFSLLGGFVTHARKVIILTGIYPVNVSSICYAVYVEKSFTD